jgi:hypothetical protein
MDAASHLSEHFSIVIENIKVENGKWFSPQIYRSIVPPSIDYSVRLMIYLKCSKL